MRILTRYFVTRYLGLYAAVLLLSTLSITTIEMMLRYDEIFSTNAGASGALDYVLLRIPSYYLHDLIPIAAFVAGFLTLGLSARSLELTAVAAGGIPLYRVTTPILLAATVLAAGAYLLDEKLISTATQGWNTQSRAHDQRLVFHRGAFWYHKGNNLYNIAGSDPETSTLRGVEVFQRTPQGRLAATIHAARVRVDAEGTWHFDNATVRSFVPEEPERPSRLERGVDLEIEVAKDRDLLLMQADFASLPLPALRAYLLEQGKGDSPSQHARIRHLEMQLHRRSSEPLLVVLFTLLAIPLATRPGRRATLAGGAVLSVVTLGIFFGLCSLASNFGEVGILSAAVATWTVPAAFGLVGLGGALRGSVGRGY